MLRTLKFPQTRVPYPNLELLDIGIPNTKASDFEIPIMGVPELGTEYGGKDLGALNLQNSDVLSSSKSIKKMMKDFGKPTHIG